MTNGNAISLNCIKRPKIRDMIMTGNKNIDNFQNRSICNDMPPVTASEVVEILKTCKLGKMCGEDNVYYEHLKNGGQVLFKTLARLFSAIFTFNYVPPNLNRGIIITVHKGGRKRKDDPANYRVITLTSSILKVFEGIMLSRSQHVILDKLNIQQGGFQSQLGCMMTSFSLKECILFAEENHSKAYVCFLDA